MSLDADQLPLRKFDAHAHTVGPKRDYLRVLDAVGVQAALNLSYSGFREADEILAYEEGLRTETEGFEGRFAFACSFNVTRFFNRNYVSDVLSKLENDISQHGAVAVKIWKDLGMMLQTPDGAYVFCDDDRLTPIYDYVAARGLVIYMHIADPVAAWRPLDPASPHYGYYSRHPEFHWYGQPDKPSHDEILQHRDALVSRYPATTFVAAHLASLEHDLDLVGAFLDAHPNCRVDVAGRLTDLRRMPINKAREFFVQYQDRILFGTDWEVDENSFPGDARRRHEAIEVFASRFRQDFIYFEEVLGLSHEVLEKFYYQNAASLFLSRGHHS